MDFFTGFAVVASGVLIFLLFLALFEPGLDYRIRKAPRCALGSEEFRHLIEVLTAARMHHRTRVEVLTNGEIYYEAELEAIRQARKSINLEAYIFQRGRVTQRFVEVLAERARAGVRVNLVLDGIGSFMTWDRYFKPLKEAGGRVVWYHALRCWYTWPRMNNRTHRELIIVDGQVGFLGGAGFADHWLYPRRKHRRWRDTMFRVEGEAVAGLQSTFAENWLEASGEILSGTEYFPFVEGEGDTAAMVITSSPSSGRSTRGRILYQTLIASAKRSIHISTPYFLPDSSARQEIVRAIKRDVEVKILVPGSKHDHLLTRRSSRRLYGQLLKAGARIFEYQPSMFHVKTMIIDETWCIVGSTNFDHRSFGLNDEVNLAAFDSKLAARLEEDFVRDLAESKPVTYRKWMRRPTFERLHELLGWVLERQQ